MSCQDKVSLKLDLTYRQLLKDLTIAYLSDEPTDFLEYACQFFQKKLDLRRASHKVAFIPVSLEEADEDIEINRMAIHGESYSPEDVSAEAYAPQVYIKTELQKNKLDVALQQILFFKFLLDSDRNHMVDVMSKMNVLANDIIITEGDEGDFFYLIECGQYEAFTIVNGSIKIVKTYDGEGFFGELALLYNTPRAMSVRAKTDGVLWTLDRTTFRKLRLKSEYESTKSYIYLLQKVPVLKSLTEKERLTVAECLKTKFFNPGEEIVVEGEVGDGMYFMVSGTAKITVKSAVGDRVTELKTVSSGDYFGELSLITKNPRAASVSAVDRVHVAFLPLDAFERLLGPCIEVMKRNFYEYDQQLDQLYKLSLHFQQRNIDKQ